MILKPVVCCRQSGRILYIYDITNHIQSVVDGSEAEIESLQQLLQKMTLSSLLLTQISRSNHMFLKPF